MTEISDNSKYLILIHKFLRQPSLICRFVTKTDLDKKRDELITACYKTDNIDLYDVTRSYSQGKKCKPQLCTDCAKIESFCNDPLCTPTHRIFNNYFYMTKVIC